MRETYRQIDEERKSWGEGEKGKERGGKEREENGMLGKRKEI